MLILQRVKFICIRFEKFIALPWRVKYWLRSSKASQSILKWSLVFSRITSCHQIIFTSLCSWVQMTQNPKNHATFFTTRWDEFILPFCTELVGTIDAFSNIFRTFIVKFIQVFPFLKSVAVNLRHVFLLLHVISSYYYLLSNSDHRDNADLFNTKSVNSYKHKMGCKINLSSKQEKTSWQKRSKKSYRMAKKGFYNRTKVLENKCNYST